jgi:hypothetical protein
MPELENVEKVKVAGFVDPRSRKNKNAERIKKDEEELQELLKAREEGTAPLLRKDTVIYEDTWQVKIKILRKELKLLNYSYQKLLEMSWYYPSLKMK